MCSSKTGSSTEQYSRTLSLWSSKRMERRFVSVLFYFIRGRKTALVYVRTTGSTHHSLLLQVIYISWLTKKTIDQHPELGTRCEQPRSLPRNGGRGSSNVPPIKIRTAILDDIASREEPPDASAERRVSNDVAKLCSSRGTGVFEGQPPLATIRRCSHSQMNSLRCCEIN